MKIALVTCLAVVILVCGCANNSYRSCDVRCKELEAQKINPACDWVDADNIKTAWDKCNIVNEKYLNYTQYCMEQCKNIN